MTASGPDPRADLPDFLVPFASMHDAMRRDVGRLTTTDLTRDPRGIARWWTCFEAVIVGHHTAEDDIVWPAIVGRLPDFAAAREQLVDEHHELDAAMARVGAAVGEAVAGRAAAELGAAVDEFVRVLDAHLTHEEEVVFPRLVRDFPRADYEQAEREIQRRGSFKDAAFELPWVLDDASPRTRTVIDGLVPAPMRLLDRVVWERRYRRIVAPLRTGA